MAAIALLLTSFNAFAEGEDDEDRRRRRGKGSGFGAHINLLAMPFGTFSTNLEYKIAKNQAAVLTLGYTYISFEMSVSDGNGNMIETGYAYNGFMAAPEYRYYFDPSRRPGLDKWYVGGYLKYASLSTGSSALTTVTTTVDPNNPFMPIVEEVEYGINYSAFALGATVGYQYAFKSGLVLGAFAGIGYNIVNDVSYTVEDLQVTGSDFNNVDIRGGATIGYRF